MTTILLPTYNCGEYISQCIESILLQSYKEYELLIIDDGSTDNTEQIVKSIKDERIIYIRNAKNLGIVASLNKGIKMAKGKYIARIDADDVMVGDRLNAQVNFLDQNSKYGMVGSWYKTMNVKGEILHEVRNHFDPNFLKLGLAFTNHFAHSSVMMRTDLARKLMYDKNFKYCEDHELWTRFAEISKVTNLPHVFLHVRTHAQSTCSQNQKELKLSVVKLLSRELNKYQIYHTAEELMLHASVCFGLSKKLIMQQHHKKKDLKRWIDKVFSSNSLENKFSRVVLNGLKRQVLKNAGIEINY